MKNFIVLLSVFFMAATGSGMQRVRRERDYSVERELPIEYVQIGDAIYYKNKNNFLGQIGRGRLSKHVDRKKLHKVILIKGNTYLWLRYRRDAGMSYKPYGIVVCSGSRRARIVPAEIVKSVDIQAMLASNAESSDIDSSVNDSAPDGKIAMRMEGLSMQD